MKSSSYLIPLIALTSIVARFSIAAMAGEKKTIDSRKIKALFVCYCTIGRAVDGKGETSGGESWCLESLKTTAEKTRIKSVLKGLKNKEGKGLLDHLEKG